MPLEQEIGDVEGIHGFEEVISNLYYRNAINIEQILNYPNENEALMESSTYEEIIEGVIDVPANDDQDPDDSDVLPHVYLKEAFLAVEILKNYLFQYEKNIQDVVYALQNIKNEIEFSSLVK
eukprot:XP_015581839.1 uncharacterized protein LOC107262167 [Ricinus communis]